MAVRKRRVVRRQKKGGHPFFVLLFFICLIMGSAYMTDRMTNAPDVEVAQNDTVIRHIFNDKERQGLVPKDDPGTPESVKEKVKAALSKAITVEVKADEEKPAEKKDISSAKEAEKVEEKPTSSKEEKEEKKDSFSLDTVLAKVTGKETAAPKAEPPKETKVASAAQAVQPSQAAPSTSSAVKESKKETNHATAKVEKAETTSSAVSTKASAPAGAKKPVEKAVPAKAASISPAKQMGNTQVTGRLAVVIDDAGRDLDSQHIYENMGIPLTLAVMPNQVHTREAATSWASHGLPVIIHQPMESVSGIGMEQKVILSSMSDDAIRQMLKDSFSQVPEAVGMNNHQGSKATTDRRVMDLVMNELGHRGKWFFDSHTNSTTEADKAAASYGVKYVKNDLFVDNSADENDICTMIQEGANRAKKNGTYIIIGHCRPHTAAAFRTMVPKLKAQGIEFVYVSSLLR